MENSDNSTYPQQTNEELKQRNKELEQKYKIKLMEYKSKITTEEQQQINRLCKADDNLITYTFTEELKQKFMRKLTENKNIYNTITEKVNEFIEKYEHIYILYEYEKRIIITNKIGSIKKSIVCLENNIKLINLILNELTINELGLGLIDGDFNFIIRMFDGYEIETLKTIIDSFITLAK
jgi:hypothetical protein